MEKYFRKTKLSGESNAPTRTPRKRFRRKVNGLFAEQSELTRRMTKLLKTTSYRDVLGADGDDGDDDGGGHYFASQSAYSRNEGDRGDASQEAGFQDGPIKLGKIMLDSLPHRQKDIQSTTWHPRVRELLQTPEKAELIKSKVGCLSPNCHQAFLEGLKVGQSTQKPKRQTRGTTKIPPPNIPRFEKGCCLVLSRFTPKPGVERIGAPAILRRNVRKRHQGYTSTDALRKRLPKEGKFDRRANIWRDTHMGPSQTSMRNIDASQTQREASQGGGDSRLCHRAGHDLHMGQHGAISVSQEHSTGNSIALLVEAAEVASERQNSSQGSSVRSRGRNTMPYYQRKKFTARRPQPSRTPLREYMRHDRSLEEGSFTKQKITGKRRRYPSQYSQQLDSPGRPSVRGRALVSHDGIRQQEPLHSQDISREEGTENALLGTGSSVPHQKKRRRTRFPSQYTQREDLQEKMELEAGSSEEQSFEETESDEEQRIPEAQGDEYEEHSFGDIDDTTESRMGPKADHRSQVLSSTSR